MILKVLRTVLCCAASMGLLACGVLPAARDRPAQSSAPADPSTALALVVAASTPPGEHSGFRLMPLGVYSLDARLQLAKRAERSLVVQYYQLENDPTGRLLVGALIEANHRLEVYVQRQEGTLPPPEARRDEAWESVLKWDAFLHESGREYTLLT